MFYSVGWSGGCHKSAEQPVQMHQSLEGGCCSISMFIAVAPSPPVVGETLELCSCRVLRDENTKAKQCERGSFTVGAWCAVATDVLLPSCLPDYVHAMMGAPIISTCWSTKPV